MSSRTAEEKEVWKDWIAKSKARARCWADERRSRYQPVNIIREIVISTNNTSTTHVPNETIKQKIIDLGSVHRDLELRRG